MDKAAEAEKLDQLLAKFPRLSIENQQYITGLIRGLKHAQKAVAGDPPGEARQDARKDARPE
ncbi:MAG: hypothetical protein LBO76_03595 [Treponema sp.]|jgi:hypothetical protein|nr:hypothetical protein [Treponema sp.]